MADPVSPVDWNRFTDLLRQQVTGARQHGDVIALILVHIRHFPIYNFRLGFAGGEVIANTLVARLQDSISRTAEVVRLAPDRIAAIVPQVVVPELLALSAQKVVDKLAEPFFVGSEIVSVMTAVGVSIFPDHGDTAEALLSEAELSLSSAFASAKSFHIPVHSHSDRHLNMMQMGSDLQTAIADEALELYYQPKFDLAAMRPVAAEALMRWTLPDGSRVRPDEFIPVAEAYGAILNLTEWAVHTALREGADIAGGGRHGVAVNLSAGIIYDPALVYVIESALAIWDLPPEQFTVEVTESSLMRNPELCFKHLSQIRDRGVKISVDDFGTGFSSLSYFKSIPADEIKIDQSFVKNMANNSDDEKLAGLIIDLSHKFGLKVVAEGIEQEAGLRMLQDMGCDIGQGYYLAKPMAASDYSAWLAAFDGQSAVLSGAGPGGGG